MGELRGRGWIRQQQAESEAPQEEHDTAGRDDENADSSVAWQCRGHGLPVAAFTKTTALGGLRPSGLRLGLAVGRPQAARKGRPLSVSECRGLSGAVLRKHTGAKAQFAELS